MSLYETWIQSAYTKDGKANEKTWDVYMPREQKIYESILQDKITGISGTISELAERYDMPAEYMCGFIDGINEAISQSIDIEHLEPETPVTLEIDFKTLYQKMVEYKAQHLFTLPQWDSIFTPEEQKELYTEQKKSTTFVRTGDKIGRNEPCPCGSGKKHKQCCGKNA